MMPARKRTSPVEARSRFPSRRRPFGRPRVAATALVSLLIMTANTVGAVRSPDIPTDAAIRVPGAGAVRMAEAPEARRLEQGAAWRAFTARYGPWGALWNARTGSPHRALGRAIPLAGYADRPEAVEAAIRGFVASQPDLFGSPTLETVRIQKVRGTWYVSFRQSVRGLPVLFSDWEFRVGSGGTRFAFGADVHRAGDIVPPAAPRLPAVVAREAARAGLRFDPGRDRVEGGESLALMPVAGESGLGYRVVAEARVVTSDPPGDWRTLVDATTGEVLWRENHVRHAIGGVVTGTVHLLLPTDPVSAQPLPNLTVNVGPTPVTTDASGAYSSAPGGAVTVSAQLRGPFVDVNRQDGVADASFSAPASDPATVNIAFDAGNSHDAERDGFLHVNEVHDYVKALDPGATNIDYVAPCKVNINNTCNAFYSSADGSVNFYVAGGGCPNTATMPDVVYHEYGHLVNEEIYHQAGVPSGMNNGALHEGMADVLAAMIQDNPDGGKGFFGPGTILRTLDNTMRWPQDASGDGHVTGLILGGAFWDLRQSAGLTVAAELSHFAKYGVPDDPDDGVAMSEYFVETLVADDDDANLGNGTPHATDIVAAFNAHGIGTGYFVNFAHVPLADQPAPGPYSVTATVSYSGPFGGLSGSPTLYYAVNDGPFLPVAMSPTGSLNEYEGAIPDASGAIVSYYLSATDTYGAASTEPAFAPSAGVHRFLAGAATTITSFNMESNSGWWVGDPADNATTGIWVWTDPVGTQVTPPTYVQPEDDHTFAGILCWVTGNATLFDPPGTNDVDGGRTTLTTALLDATAGGLVHPVISYYRWYTNNQGASPGEDVWRVEISNDGGKTWVSVENTMQSDASWRRVLFRIEDFVTPTDQMLLRFIAEDAGPGSLVEAGVDDFDLMAFQSVVAVGDAPAPSGLELALASSHPARGSLRLRYALPAAGPVSLRIHDVAGRAVRTLVEGSVEAGAHTVEWDGRDDAGRTLASGTYFARLAAGGATLSRTLVRAR